jgi:hypothetical protein
LPLIAQWNGACGDHTEAGVQTHAAAHISRGHCDFGGHEHGQGGILTIGGAVIEGPAGGGGT